MLEASLVFRKSRIKKRRIFPLDGKNTSGINVPKSAKTGKGSKKILHNHWGYSYFNTINIKDLVETLDLNLSEFPTGLSEFVICKKVQNVLLKRNKIKQV